MSPEPAIPLGPFLLRRCIGRGGMAEVWSGVHAAQGVPVAVKVMTGERARNPVYRAAFRNEVQAVASLDHPGIVMVFEHGETGAATEESSRGLLPAGSPYLAMELAEGGTLAALPVDDWTWNEARQALRSLLDALAHAHARGVVHRDLKPTNVLVFAGGTAVPRLKLADFGLAQAFERQTNPDSTGFVCGTPSYMAPEQLRGEARDYGPWTDLYSLGCLAWALVTGRPPFNAGLIQLVQLQLEEEPPPFEPLFPVPAGLEAWLRRLLVKEPGRRFLRTADAAWALRRLEDGSPGGDRVAPPLPDTWDRPETRPASMRLVGAGLGLYGLRTIPLIGRRRERDALWQALASVRATEGGSGRARLLLLRGAAGNGKTRLAEWLAERADEVGGATVLRASHGPNPGAEDGLARMMARHLRCVGQPRVERLARVRRLLESWKVTDEDEWIGLADLMGAAAVDADEDLPAPRLQTAADRFALLERHCRRLARQRPVLLLLDDVHWSAESIAFAHHLLARREEDPLPILILLTVRDEALAERRLESAALGELLALPGATAIEVPPLPSSDRATLIHELLGLEGELAAQVDARTAGNPLFAVELVGDWVQRGVLQVTDRGFVLRPGVEVQLPDDLHEVWSGRVDRLVAGLPARSREALEIAAALGPLVDRRQWETACGAAGAPCPPALADSLIATRLAVRTEEGWSFVHAMLRESLERMAREAGRWAAHNRACAAMLLPRAVNGERGIAERLGRHLLLAGQPENAVEFLLRGARERRETSDYEAARALLAQRDDILASLGAHARDPRWGQGWVLRARIHLHQGQLEEVFRWAGRAVSGGVDGDWSPIRAESLRLLGDAARRRGDLDQALERYASCLASPDPHGAAASLWGLGDVARQRGDLQRARAFFDRSRLLFEEIGDEHGVADHLIGQADLARQARDPETALNLYVEAAARFEQLGNRYGVARGLNGLGEVARLGGDLGRAAVLYRRSLALLDTLGSADAIFPRVNLALVALAEERYGRAREALDEARERLETMGWGGLLACVHLARLSCAARERAWGLWDDAFDRAAAALAAGAFFDPDLAWTAELAGQAAESLGDAPRARAAYDLARAQRRGLSPGAPAAAAPDSPGTSPAPSAAGRRRRRGRSGPAGS